MNKSPNYTKSNNKKIGYIIHGTLGKYDGAINWLCTPPEKRPVVSYSSAHYVIAKDGRYEQLVDDKDVAWHCGNISNPTERAKSILPVTDGKFLNPNESFIGIELEWFLGDKITEQQYKTINDIIVKGGITNPKIMCHKEVTDYKVDFQTQDGRIDSSIVQEINKRICVSSMPTHVTNFLKALKEFQVVENISPAPRIGPATTASLKKFGIM